MIIDDKKSALSSNIMQNLVMENREKVSITGVNDVLSFDDQIVILGTSLGLLTLKGENLRINKLSLDSEDVIIEGDICTVSYSDKDIERKPNTFLGKIFKW